MHTLKHLFLGMTLLSIIKPITATETLFKEDFASFLNKGLFEFVEQFGKEKKVQLGIEDWVEKQRLEKEQRLRLEQEVAESQKAADAEQQRIRPEAEQKLRDEQAKAAELLNSSINTTIKRISDLQTYQLTFGDLVKVLNALEEYYRGKPENHAYEIWREELTK